MKRHIPTLAIALACSIISAAVTAWIISSHYQNVMMMFIGGRPADYLISAAKIREGKSDQLINFLEYNAQVEILQNQHAKNDTWTFAYSRKIFDAYTRRYNIKLADPLADLDPPTEVFSGEQFLRLLDIAVPDKWPDWFFELKTK